MTRKFNIFLTFFSCKDNYFLVILCKIKKMKKLFTILLLFVTVISYAGSKSSANDFSKTLAYQIFWNDSLSIESYSSNSDFCLEEKGKDVLKDGIEIFFGKDYYKLYSPKLKTVFTVKTFRKGASVGNHLIWLIKIVRTHNTEDFNFSTNIVSNPQNG